MTTSTTSSEALLDGLHATAPQPLPFAPQTNIRAFLLERPDGNLLVYSTGTLAASMPEFEALGGISRHYINHHHEAMFASDTGGAPVFAHEDEAEQIATAYAVRGTFSRRHTLGADFEAIPIPGHTSGATAYLWDSGRHRYLFTGDSIMLSDDGEWRVALLDSSDRDAYIESLELLRDVEFDVLVPWAASGERPYALTDRADARRRLDAIAARLRRGETR